MNMKLYIIEESKLGDLNSNLKSWGGAAKAEIVSSQMCCFIAILEP